MMHYWSIAELGRALRRGDVSSREATQAQLDRIETLNPTLRPYLTVLADRAQFQASAADAAFAASVDHGPLQGVPVGIKDLIDLAGERTTAGSSFYGETPVSKTATLAQRMLAGGAVVLGKQHLHEFAAGGPMNATFGQTFNPWNRDHYTGGSSSGSGVATAAGLNYASIGSDTAGSIRFPAAYCGVTGLKPTYGRVPVTGVVTLAWSFDHLGPLARSAEDCAIVLSVIAGHDPADTLSSREPVGDYLAHLDAGVRGLRIGVPTNLFFDDLHPETEAAVREAIRVLASLGATVRDVTVPHAEESVDLIDSLLWPEVATYHQTRYAERAADYGDLVARRIESGLATAAPIYLNGLRRRAAITAEWTALFDEFDVLMLPTVHGPAERVDATSFSIRPMRLKLSWPFDLTGLPAISLPAGFSSDGLPLAVQIVGRPFAEATILRAGHAFQQATDWHTRRPVA